MIQYLTLFKAILHNLHKFTLFTLFYTNLHCSPVSPWIEKVSRRLVKSSTPRQSPRSAPLRESVLNVGLCIDNFSIKVLKCIGILTLIVWFFQTSGWRGCSSFALEIISARQLKSNAVFFFDQSSVSSTVVKQITHFALNFVFMFLITWELAYTSSMVIELVKN